MNIRKSEPYYLYSFLGILAAISLVLFLPLSAAGQKERGDGNYPQSLKELVHECTAGYQGVPWIRVSEFNSLSKKEEWIIVDTRNIIERALSIIPGSRSIDEFENVLETQRKKNILVYDTVGCRSGEYVQKLKNKGLNVFGLWGGALAWAWNGRTFVTPDGVPTRALHVFQRKWNVLPPGYEGGW